MGRAINGCGQVGGIIISVIMSGRAIIRVVMVGVVND